MCPFPQALQFLVVAVAGWVNQQQRDVIDYLQEENRVLREHIPARRLRFTDGQRRRLAAKAKTLGRRALGEFETLVTPDTLLTATTRNCNTWGKGDIRGEPSRGSRRSRTSRPCERPA